jgi:hypothetical protein
MNGDLPYKVFDNVLDNDSWQTLTKEIMHVGVPWNFSGTTYTIDSNCSFSCVPAQGDFMHDILYKCVEDCLHSVGISSSGILRMRLALIPKTDSKINIVNDAHVDSPMQHMVGLLYINDSDGETILYNETIDRYKHIWSNDGDFYRKHLKGNLTEMTRISPKANRLVVFDGRHFHSSSTPTNVSRRVAFNFNFMEEYGTN